MWKDLVYAYRGAFRFAFALPLLFAIPVAAEFAQHVAEVQAGMFDSFAAAGAAAGDPGRAIFGLAKMLGLALILFWVTRYLGSGGDLRGAARIERGPAMQFMLVLLVNGLLLAVGGACFALLGEAGLDRRLYLLVMVAVLTAQMAIATLLAGWWAGAALGDGRMSARASIRLVAPRLWYSLTYLSIVTVPAMALHYALNLLAIGRSVPVMWAMLAVDSLVVALLGAVLAAANFAVASRAAERGGITLRLSSAQPARAL